MLLSPFIKSIETTDTGGHVIVDLIHLESGHLMTVTHDSVCIWHSFEDYEKSFEGQQTGCAVVYLPEGDEEFETAVEQGCSFIPTTEDGWVSG